MPRHCTTVRVRYADTDQAGVVYHANYVPWFETGRTESLRAHGIPYTELTDMGINLPVVDLHVRYHRAALYDQLIEIWTGIEEVTRTRVHFVYTLQVAGESRPLATARTIQTFVDDDGRVLRMDRFPEVWQRIQAAAAELSDNEE